MKINTNRVCRQRSKIFKTSSSKMPNGNRLSKMGPILMVCLMIGSLASRTASSEEIPDKTRPSQAGPSLARPNLYSPFGLDSYRIVGGLLGYPKRYQHAEEEDERDSGWTQDRSFGWPIVRDSSLPGADAMWSYQAVRDQNNKRSMPPRFGKRFGF